MAGQFGERPVSVLAPVHAHERAAPRRDHVDRNDLAVLAERVRQLFLSDELAQVADPQRRAAHAEALLLDGRQSAPLAVALLFALDALLLAVFSVPRARPAPASVAVPRAAPRAPRAAASFARSRPRARPASSVTIPASDPSTARSRPTSPPVSFPDKR